MPGCVWEIFNSRLAINNWFNADKTKDKITVVEKNASIILVTKEAWLTKFPLCQSSILRARERAFHLPFLITESFPTCLITHTICSSPEETIQPVCGEFLKHLGCESRQDEQDLILTKDDGTFSMSSQREMQTQGPGLNDFTHKVYHNVCPYGYF